MGNFNCRQAVSIIVVAQQNHSVMDMVAHAAAKAGKEPTIVHHPAHPADVQQTLADPRKSQNLLGFTPLHPFTGG